MYTRITKAGGRQYLQLVESYRNESGKPRVRVVASLGRLDKIQKTKKIDPLINGLARAAGRTQTDDGDIVYELATEHGSLLALDGLWRDLGLDKSLRCALRSGRRKFDAEELIRVMVFNRLCDPRSKLGILRWLRKVSIPGVNARRATHQRLLRAMDALEKDAERVEKELAASFRPLLDEELTITFYDLTTIRIHGEKSFEGDIRACGKSKDVGGIARQFTLGMVQTADGLPLMHRVHPGNVAETKTLQSVVSEVLERFPVKRLVLVADRGLLSYDNIGELEKLSGKDGRNLEFILAVPARKYAQLAEAFREIDEGKIGKVGKNGERLAEMEFAGHRLVVAHDPERAKERTNKRKGRLGELQKLAQEMVGRLDAAAAGEKIFGPGLTEQEARDRLADAVSGAKFKKFMQTRLTGGRFCWTIDEAALRKAELFDGKLAVVTNVKDLAPAEVIVRYKELADIERGFRVLKSEIEIAPVFHWLPERIRAHALICFLALVLHRVMRMRLKAAGVAASPETVLETLAEIQRHRIFIGKRMHEGNTTQTPAQKNFFDALKVRKPA